MNFWFAIVVLFCGISFNVCEGGIVVLDSDDPGSCDKSNHAEEVLVKDRENGEKILICTENKGIYQWRTIDGVSPPGELFNPGYDCSDILDKNPEAKDGFYWIQLDGNVPKKVWCDMTTDGGGFMLIGRKNDSTTLTVPSDNYPVEPFGYRHWSSALGDAPILDFRIQMATSEDFKQTKAHWSFRLQNERPLKNLMVLDQGCNPGTAGIGNIAYVKDLQTEKIVSTTFRCSMFGYGHNPKLKFGWNMMNSCLKKPCSNGFGFYDHPDPKVKLQTDTSGAFSYSVTGNVSGIHYDSTAFIGCDNDICCACYGPLGGMGNYCGDDCQAKPGGTITKNVYTWFWVRSALPKSVWNKCMEYQVTADNGDIEWYKLKDGSGVPKKGRCAKNEALLNDGIVVVSDSAAARKIPSVPGLMEYRKDNKKLYVRANKTWNVVAQENKVLKKTSEMVQPKLNEFEKRLDNQNQVDNRINTELSRLETWLGNVNQTLHGIVPISSQPECSSYSSLTDANRNVKDTSSTVLCDGTLSPGWYRFGGKAGTRMPTTCVPENGCGTHAPGWINGNHPTVNDGKVTRTVCFNWSGNCCSWSTSIEVINCGYFYIYKLGTPPNCSLRYCGSDK